MANVRQTILVRTDLGFTSGLMAAQCAHLHMEGIRRFLLDGGELDSLSSEWLETPYVFIHGVPNPEILKVYIGMAKDFKIKVHEWRDTVYVKVSDEMTDVPINAVLVGAVLGPDDSDTIKAVIGKLPLLP